jgi:hypothetical protein
MLGVLSIDRLCMYTSPQPHRAAASKRNTLQFSSSHSRINNPASAVSKISNHSHQNQPSAISNQLYQLSALRSALSVSNQLSESAISYQPSAISIACEIHSTAVSARSPMRSTSPLSLPCRCVYAATIAPTQLSSCVGHCA